MSSQANISPKQGLTKSAPDAQSPPTISFAASPETTYMVVGLDIDAPFPSFNILSPILHWIQSGLKLMEPDGFNEQKYAPRNGQNLGNMHRMRYDLDAWEEEVKLGPVLAMNYFMSN
ncbi:hypothetical protein EYZ11_009632 [Aspergillus tanneri]|uniref:Uncharacterized protein n=1 Tax=Aspergillus tanneri TaxID=1220188 RepID=A0A4S3J7Q0_9EURO|nr:hypothetical protein EYZ11_009632 [Aspergillus tanneri]